MTLTSRYGKFNHKNLNLPYQNWSRFVKDMTNILAFFRFTLLKADHLQNVNAKFHKVEQRHYSGEVENVHIPVQIYSAQYVLEILNFWKIYNPSQ